MYAKRSFLLCATLAIAACATAQGADSAWTLQDAVGSEHLKLSGTARIRYETLQGQPRTTFSSSDELLSMRNTLSVQYLAGVWRFGAELYEGRGYLADTDSAISTNEIDALEPVQAYLALDLKDPFGTVKSLSVQTGRFIMNVGSRRLISTDDYRNTANGFTGIRAQLKSRADVGIDLFYAYPQLRLPDDISGLRHNDIQLDREGAAALVYGLMLTTPRRFAGGLVELGWIALRERDAVERPTRDRSIKTLDARYLREPAPDTWDLEVETAYQYGRARTSLAATAPLREVAAAFYHFRLGYQWDRPWKPHLAFDFDFASGEGQGQRSHRFDTLFGMRRADLAPSGLFSLIGRANISSPGVRFETAPGKRLDTLVTYRGLWLASNTDAFSTIGIRDASGRAGDFAGQQLDARVRYWLIPTFLRFELDGVLLFKGRFLREAPNARDNGDARFLSLNLQATF